MKSLSQYIFEQMNQSDEDFFITMLGWIVQDGGGMKVEDDVIKLEVKKEHKKETLDLCQKEGFEVLKAEAAGRGYTAIEIKRDKTKQVKKYNLNESEEDGKGGHYEEFVDEETGEIVTMWVKDPDPELEKLKWEAYEKEQDKQRQLRKKIKEQEKDLVKKQETLEDELWGYEQDLKDANRQYRQLQIDQEDEVGSLYADGKEKKAEKLAQEYGEKFNKLADEIESLKNKMKKIQPQIAKLEEERDKLWEPYWKLDDELLKKYQELSRR